MPRSTQPLDPVSIGRFLLKGRLASTEACLLYRAQDAQTASPVALKCGAPGLDPHLRDARLLGEWEASQRLIHPGIHQVLELGQDPGLGHYLVLEALEGRCLASLLAGELSAYQSLHLLVQLVHVLTAAQKEGFLHGDLRPENLWIDPAGTLMVLGFGACTGPELAGPKIEFGAMPYQTPERLRGSEPTSKTEIFAFTVLAFRLLTGRLPFREAPGDAEGTFGLGRTLAIPTDIPKPLQRAFGQAMDWRPENHFTSLHDFLGVLIAATPLEEEKLEALLSLLDGNAVALEMPWAAAPGAMPPLRNPSPRDTQPMAIQMPVAGTGPVSGSLGKRTLPARTPLAQLMEDIRAFLAEMPGVQEFLVSQNGGPAAASASCKILAGLQPTALLEWADSSLDPEHESPANMITLKSPRKGSILIFRHSPFSIALVLKPGKSPKAILDGIHGLKARQA